MLDVKPTRSELLNLKKKIQLAKSGHKLLKKKRDGMIMEFFRVLEEAREVMKETAELYKVARERLILAEVTEGATKLRSISLAVRPFPPVKLTTSNLMGVKVSRIEVEGGELHMLERGVGLLSTKAKIDEASYYYRLLVEKLVKYAEYVSSIQKLLDEIEKTKRKVNALEYNIIPRLEDAANFVRQRLEEMERENVFRLKKVKSKKRRA